MSNEANRYRGGTTAEKSLRKVQFKQRLGRKIRLGQTKWKQEGIPDRKYQRIRGRKLYVEDKD